MPPPPRKPRSILSSIGGALLLSVVVLWSAAPFAMASDPRRDEPTRLELMSAVLFELEASDLERRAESLRASDERTLTAAMILRAGRAVPPGVGAARAALRQERADEAVSWLRQELASPTRRSGLLSVLREALREVRNVPRPLHEAALETVARLDLVELAPEVARTMGEGADAESATAARDVLRRLTGHKLASVEEAEALWGELRLSGLGPAALTVSREALLEAGARADRAVVQLMAVAASRVEGPPFALSDPALAAEAARLVASAVGGGQLSPDAARTLLSDGLFDEHRPVVLQARVQSLLDLVQGADPAAEEVLRTRQLLRDLAGDRQSGGVSTVSPARAWVVLAALPRLDRGESAEADAARVEDLQLGAALLDALLASPTDAPLDPDGLEGAIASLIDLARSISNEELRSAAARGLVLDLKDLVRRRGVVPLAVRRAAARGLRLSIEPSDAKDLLDLMRSMGGGELDYELLGALRAAFSVLDPRSQQAEEAISALFTALGEDDFDARSRAIAVLLDPGVAPALSAQDLRSRSDWVLERLPVEPSMELRVGLLDLLGRIGDERIAAELLASEALADLCGSDGVSFIETLGGALLRLAGDDGGRALEGSRALVAIPMRLDAAGGESRLVARGELLRESLRLDLAALSRDGTIHQQADHLRALRSALELMSLAAKTGLAPLDPGDLARLAAAHAGPLEAEAPSTGDLLVERTVHAVRAFAAAADAATWTPVEDDADQAEHDVRVQEIAAITAHFDAAAALAPAAHEAGLRRWSSRALQLEAIRFLSDQGQGPEAVRRMEGILDAIATSREEPVTPALARSYIDLVLSLPGESDPEPARLAHIRAALALAFEDARTRTTGLPDPVDAAWFRSVFGGSSAEDTRLDLRTLLESDPTATLFEDIDEWLAGESDQAPREEESKPTVKSP